MCWTCKEIQAYAEGVDGRRDAESATGTKPWTMCRRRRDATRRFHTHSFARPRVLAMLIFCVSLISATKSVEIQIYGISPTVNPTSPGLQASQFSVRKIAANDSRKSLSSHEVVHRLEAAAILRTNMLTLIGRILLLPLDKESRIAFERVYQALRTRYVPVYDYLSLIPIIRGKISKQQLHSVLRLMQRISTPYISSYATLCLEALSDGRVNVELTSPTDLLLGIDNSTRNSLAMDKERIIEVPLTFEDAVSTLMAAIGKDRIQPDLELIAALMLNLPNFDITNPEVPDTVKYVAKYMKQSSKPDDPILEYLNGDQITRADRLVKVVLERILASESSPFTIREPVGLLLQNFREIENRVEFHRWNTTKLFDIVVPDFYPRSIVAIAKYLQQNLNHVIDRDFDLSRYTTELQALGAVITQIYENPYLPEPVKESVEALGGFVAQKQREEDPGKLIDEVNISRAVEYLRAFRSPCLPEKLRAAAQTLWPYLNDKLPWDYAFGDTRLSGNPYELLVNALINFKNIKISDKLGRVLDNFIYHAQSSGTSGKRSIIYEQGIIFQREDSDVVELDVYSILEILPNVFHDERFSPLLTFFAKPNLLGYLGHGFNMFVHTEPRALLIDLITKASAKPAVKTDKELCKVLQVSRAILEEPTLVNTYSFEELEDIITILPAIDSDPRYLPIKLLFKSKNLFRHISPGFSLAGLETADQHIALILNTVALKPIHKRLEESIIFALANLEGPQLPVRNFTRDDFVYLVTELFRHDKITEIAILKSHIYKTVSNWNIAVSGRPENVLARTLGYPVEKLSRNPELSAFIEKAEKILDEETFHEIKPLNKKILDKMLEYLPDIADLRPVYLLLKKANLAILLPKVNVFYLENHQPREALIILLENLISSSSADRKRSLNKKLNIALESVRQSAHPSVRDVSSVATEELLNPLAPKYKPLWTKFRELNGNLTLKNDKGILNQFLLRLQEDTSNEKLSEAARLALQEIYYSVDSGMIPAIKDTEIIGALSLLPNEPKVEPLKKLLTPSWILDILPQDFRSSEYPSKEQIMRIILLMTKQRPEIIENPILMSAISAAESSLVTWKHGVEPLRKIVSGLKTALYDPVRELLKPHNLNKLELNFFFDAHQKPKELLIGLLHNLMLHPKITADSLVMHVLESLQQDVLNFGLDSDLLWVLDDAGIPYDPNLAPVRLFLHTTASTSRLGPLVNQLNGNEKRYNKLLDLLLSEKYVHADQDLLRSVHELQKMEPHFNNPSEVTEKDVMDIVAALPEEIIARYPDVQKLFTSETLKELAPYSEIIRSAQPVMMLLLKLGRLSKVLRNQDLWAKVFEFYEALGDVIYKPVISGYNLRPLLRELRHVQQINVDYILQIIDPKMLSVLLPEGLDDHDNIQDDTELLINILNGVLAQRVLDTDAKFKSHVSSFRRDVAMIADGKIKAKKLLSDQEMREMLKFIPTSTEFAAIRHFIERNEVFDHIPKLFDWNKYPTFLNKLRKILEFVERHYENDNHLRESVRALNAHLLRNYFFVNEDNVKMLLDAINELSVDHDLVPLRLFLTAENLIRYLPSDMNIDRVESPKKALIVVLRILRENEKLQMNKLLQNSISAVIKAVEKAVASGEKELDIYARRMALIELTKYDLRFILNLEIASFPLKNYLDPANLVKALPKSFSFASKPTFKAKVLHLLKYLASNELGPVQEIEKIIHKVNFLNDLPSVNSTDLEPLVAAIDGNTADIDFHLIKKYLTVQKLVNLLPGNFNIKNNTNIKEALALLTRTVSYSLGGTEKEAIVAFEKFLRELQKPLSSVIKTKANIKLADLKSLIEEIPITKCEFISSVRQDLRADEVLKMLPVNLNLSVFKTRRLKLLEILKNLKEHPDAAEFREFSEMAEECVREMQDVPKLSDRDIRQILKSTDLNQKDKNTLLENCRAFDLAEYLPIAFDIRNLTSYKSKVEAVIDSCKKLEFKNATIGIALKKAGIFTIKLPSTDITQNELNQIFEEICCCNFTSLKPLIKFLATNNLRSLLPFTLNLDKKSTLKNKLLSLLTVLRNIDVFQTEIMFNALNTAEETVHRLQNRPDISQQSIDSLKELPVMMAQSVNPFNKIFLLNNLLKVVPPSFNINDYETESSKLLKLLKYSENMSLVKRNNKYAASLMIARDMLLREAEDEIWNHLQKMIKNVDEHIPLMLYVESQKPTFFDGIKIEHGFEYQKVKDRLRVVLKFMSRMEKVSRSNSLVESIDSLISQLSVGQPTNYEIDEAINEIPDLMENQNLKIYLRCKDVRKQANGLNLTPEHTAKRILLDLLKIVRNTTLDEETIADIDRTIPDVQRATWDEEAEELFKQIPNFTLYLEKLEAVRSYYILHGPDAIFGTDYREVLPSKLDRLKKLVQIILASAALSKDKKLQPEVKYLDEILTNPTNSTIPEDYRTMQDIDMNSLLSVLPKIKSENLILGLLKFFSDPELIPIISKAVDPSQFKSQGSLMQEIINFGLNLDKVKNDPIQLNALNYVKDKILMIHSGALPIKLNTLSRHAMMRADLIGVLKSVDMRAANLSNVIPIMKFFDMKYDPLIHGRGFDHRAHTTRGTYLKAFLEHLIANPDVQQDIKRHAKLLIEYVRLDGPGAEPVDVNEDAISNKRAFYNESDSGYRQVRVLSASQFHRDYLTHKRNGMTAIYSHFRSSDYSYDHWQRISVANTTIRLQPTPIPITKLMHYERSMAVLMEKGRFALETSINRILESKTESRSIDVENRNGLIADPEELDHAKNEEYENKWPLDSQLVENRKTLGDRIEKTLRFEKSILPQFDQRENENRLVFQSNKSKSFKRETKEDFTSLQLNDDASFDPESATFSPDKVLVDVERRLNEGPFNGPGSEEVAYVTEEDAEKLGQREHHQIRPLMVNPADLPAETDSEYEVIPHTLSKTRQRVDLISRKLFVRNDTDPDLFIEHRNLSDDPISIRNRENLSNDNKTVKKDLSQASNGEYRVLTDFQTETIVDQNGVTDLLPVPEALTLHRSTPPELTITRTNSELKSKQAILRNKSTAVRYPTCQITDVMTVEEFKAHWWQNGTWGNRPPPTSVDQTRNILNGHKTSDANDHSNHNTKGIINEDSSGSETREESEEDVIPHWIFRDEDLDIPVASED